MKKIGKHINIPIADHIYSTNVKIGSVKENFDKMHDEIKNELNNNEKYIEKLFLRSMKLRNELENLKKQIDILVNDWKNEREKISKLKNPKIQLQKLAKIKLNLKKKCK